MEKLSATEEEVMQAIWKQGSGFIRDFMERMKAPPAYTTVASIVRNLEKKGYLKSKKMANSYYYEALIAAEDYNRRRLSDVVKDYFADSYKDMVTFFAHDKKISPRELKEIIALIDKKK